MCSCLHCLSRSERQLFDGDTERARREEHEKERLQKERVESLIICNTTKGKKNRIQQRDKARVERELLQCVCTAGSI